MIDIEKVLKNEKLLKSLTDASKEKFEELLLKFDLMMLIDIKQIDGCINICQLLEKALGKKVVFPQRK